MLKTMLEDGTSSAEEERARFLANMSEGLHALAQPLTILRMALAACVTPGLDATRQQRYMDRSHLQIERACNLFDLLQDLVIASHMEADREPFGLNGLIATVAEAERASLHASGIKLELSAPSELPTVWGDAERTQQAIAAGLRAATSLSSAGEVIELLVSIVNGHVECIIRNDHAHGKPLNASDRLSLAVAAANVLSQEGTYEFFEDPFCARMALPLHLMVTNRERRHR